MQIAKVVNMQAMTIKQEEKKACFQTDERYFCKNHSCSCSDECKKLIAVWMR